METTTASLNELAASSKKIARRLLTIGENRLELLTVEVQQERENLLHAVLLALGVAAFGLLMALTLTATLVVLLWAWSPWAVLLASTVFYGAAGIYLYSSLSERLRNWQTLPASLDQIRKDHACFEKLLG